MRIMDWRSDVCSSDRNRLTGGRFKRDGKTWQTPINNGANALHGGTLGFDKVLWDVTSVKSGPTASVTLRYVSPDGDQGYPGTMTVDAIYSLDENDDLRIEYVRSEEHTSELQSLMRLSYAVFCLKKQKKLTQNAPI